MKISYGNVSLEMTVDEFKALTTGQVQDIFKKLKAAAAAIGEKAKKVIKKGE